MPKKSTKTVYIRNVPADLLKRLRELAEQQATPITGDAGLVLWAAMQFAKDSK